MKRSLVSAISQHTDRAGLVLGFLRKAASITVVALALVSCSSTPEKRYVEAEKRYVEALQTFEAENYGMAARKWRQLADEGDRRAEFALGYMSEFGYGLPEPNLAQASYWYLKSAKQDFTLAMVHLGRLQVSGGHPNAGYSWLTLAARWGNKDAINLLNDSNKTVPEPDLLRKYQQIDQKIAAQQATEEAENREFWYNLGRLIGAAAVGAAQGYSRGQVYPAATAEAQAEDKPREVSKPAGGCSSDFSCSYGHRCVKRPYSNYGVCLREVDEDGLPTYDPPSTKSIGPTSDSACYSSADCPVTFSCDKELKVCVRSR